METKKKTERIEVRMATDYASCATVICQYIREVSDYSDRTFYREIGLRLTTSPEGVIDRVLSSAPSEDVHKYVTYVSLRERIIENFSLIVNYEEFYSRSLYFS